MNAADQPSAQQPQRGTDTPNADLPSTQVWRAKQKGQEAKTKVKSLLSERETGHLHRSFSFPVPVDCNGLRARLKDGLLKVRVPKAKAGLQRETFPIEVED